MNKKIGVLGCGWLGLPLAKYLVEKGNQISGTTTLDEKLLELKKIGIEPFLIKLGTQGIQGDIKGFLKDLEILILNVPPNLRKPPFENYVQKIHLLKEEILASQVEKVIFVSSTSVYGNIEGEVSEESPTNPSTESGKSLLESEQLLHEEKRFETTIIRFGGLIGEDRHPITFLTGREKLTNGDEPINLIHQIDCIGIISQVIEQGYWGKVINGVYPNHPKKREYYIAEAKKRNLQLPDYVNTSLKSIKKIIKCKNFPYKYISPITTA